MFVIGGIIMLKWKQIKIVLSILIVVGSIVSLITQKKLEKCRDRTTTSYAITADLKTSIEKICKDSGSPENVITDCSKLVCEELSLCRKE